MNYIKHPFYPTTATTNVRNPINVSPSSTKTKSPLNTSVRFNDPTPTTKTMNEREKYLTA
jgi:hypothetical protein